ncbi:MAG: hypothetical protein Q7J78_02860 [Clostridiales bacterium]|nr:hypothetical protein [Clostridiales bacterium]
MYHCNVPIGRRGFGLELLRKNLEIYSCKWGYTWDGAIGGSGLGDTGGLINRIIKAVKAK